METASPNLHSSSLLLTGHLRKFYKQKWLLSQISGKTSILSNNICHVVVQEVEVKDERNSEQQKNRTCRECSNECSWPSEDIKAFKACLSLNNHVWNQLYAELTVKRYSSH